MIGYWLLLVGAPRGGRALAPPAAFDFGRASRSVGRQRVLVPPPTAWCGGSTTSHSYYLLLLACGCYY